MSATNMNNTTTNNVVAPGDGEPSTFDWETAVAHDIEQALDPEITTNKPDLAILRIIRELLCKLEADSHEARSSLVVAAAHEVCEYYRGAYLDSEGEGFYFSQQDDHGSGQMTDMVYSYAWQVAMLFPATDVRHAALAELIAAFKSVCSSAPDVFDAKNPRVKFVNRDLEGVADDFWGKHHITGLDRKLHSGERLQAECDRTVRCSAFLARLLGLGILSPSVGTAWALRDVREYLAAADDDAVEDAVWRCRVLAAAQPFIYAGEVLAREVKKQEQSAKPRARLAFTGDARREWASGFAHAVARAGDGKGEVEMAARAAKGKMAELWPGMFTEGGHALDGRTDEGKV